MNLNHSPKAFSYLPIMNIARTALFMTGKENFRPVLKGIQLDQSEREF